MSHNDAADEIPHAGGRLTAGVVRVGNTVRRPTGPDSPFAHALLTHLEAVGFAGAPRLVGIDDQGWLWTISADDGPPIPEQGRRLRLMADAYGLADTRGLLNGVMARQEENLADALARARSFEPAVARYGQASAAWQGEQMAWLRKHQRAFRIALAR